jgi:predicted nucleotidyltransferase
MTRDDLVERIGAVLTADDRVLAAWLTGSLGRGDGDRWSDVDVFAAVKAEELDGFVAGWEDVAVRIAPTVLLRRTGTVFTHVTTEWLRFDVTIAGPDTVPGRWRPEHRLLFDHAGLDDRLGTQVLPLETSAAHVLGLTEEFLRVLGLLPVVLGRDELEVAASGAGLLRQMLVQLLVEEAGGHGRGGALRLRQVLAPDRLRLLRDLPSIAASRESAIAVHVACASAFLPLARDLARRMGATWPRELEAAAAAHLHRELGIDI